jgi:hypothetical protein
MMACQLILEKLYQFGYKPIKFERVITQRTDGGIDAIKRTNLLPSFEHVYTDSAEKEAYIIVEKDYIFSNDEIRQYVDEIVGSLRFGQTNH